MHAPSPTLKREEAHVWAKDGLSDTYKCIK